MPSASTYYVKSVLLDLDLITCLHNFLLENKVKI